MSMYQQIKQRGIFSELVNPENTVSLANEEKRVKGPNEKLEIHVNQKQQVPKAFSISSYSDSLTQEEQRKDNLKKMFMVSKILTTVDPKVVEPFDPIPGRVPRKVAIDRKKKQYANFDIEELLLQEGVDYNNQKNNENVEWLELELFDDNSYDDYVNINWIEKARSEGELGHALTGKGLYLDTVDNLYKWKSILIYDFIQESQMFQASWRDEDSTSMFEISRINFVLDAENPIKFAKRVAMAHNERLKVDSLIRYNYYIDNMPIQDLNDLDAEQKRRLEYLTRTKKLEGVDPTPLLLDVCYDYQRTMNKIIFDKYLNENIDQLDNKDIFPIKLNLEAIQQENDKFTNKRDFGMMKLQSQIEGSKEYIFENQKKLASDPKDFSETFQNFCFASLYIKKEVIQALQEIRKECNKILEFKMYNYVENEFPANMHLEEFKNIQDAEISGLFFQLKGLWVQDLINIIKTEFEGVGKGWFNMKETSKVTYDFGKLKRFLTVVKLMMQDTLLSLMMRSQKEFVDYFTDFIPEKVIINSTSDIQNIYRQGLKKEKKILFTIDLNKNNDDTDFMYSTNPKAFISTLLAIYDKSIEEGNKIPDIEPSILSDLFKSNKNDAYIKSPIKTKERPREQLIKTKTPVIDEHKWVWTLYIELEEKMSLAILPLYEYLEKFGEFKEIIAIKPDDYVRQLELEENPKEVDELKQEIYRVRGQRLELQNKMPESVQVSMFEIQCKDILIYMLDKYEQLEKGLLNLIARRFRDSNRLLALQFEAIKLKLKEQPSDIEALTDLKEYMQNLPIEIAKIESEQKSSLEIYKTLEDFNFRFSKDDMNRKWQVFGNTKEVMDLMDLRKNALEKDKVKFLESMRVNQLEFKQMVESLEQTIQNFHNHQQISAHEEIANNVESVQSQLVQYQEDAKKYNFRETLFELDEQSDFSQLQSMARDFLPYSNLWSITHKWKVDNVQWLDGEWNNLDAEAAEKFIEDSSRSLQGVIRHFGERDHTAVLKIAQVIKQEIDQFKPKVPIMVALRKKGMKQRHWDQISAQVGFTVSPGDGVDFCFQKILDMGLLQHSDAICEIGERAAKEYQIETMLNQMQEKWENINFDLLDYKKTFIVRGADEIQQVIDEHLVNTQSMQFSPFKKPFEDRIQEWGDKLKLMSDIMEEWLKCQGQWMYLQPIFDSADIAKQLPQETKKFKTVDQTWRHTMTQAKTFVQVLKVCSDQTVLDKLQEANKNLDMIQKELDNYLGKKREKFARFYFLSNDDLLDILSQAKDPTAVQPFLKIVFENMHEVEFNADKPPKIMAMMSAEKEKVYFPSVLDPNNKNVEDWMGELEDMMKNSVRHAFLHAVQSYSEGKRTDWVRANPGQCVLNGSQVHWTSEVETAIKSKGVVGIQEYVIKLNEQLNDLVDLVRIKLTAMETITLNALVVIDVHARDVITKLINNNVNDIGVFEWISQLRYYWEKDDVYVKCIQTVFPYGYEYLGNTPRLVITELTDKCYMTLMGALKLNLGGAPAGPAGTGKTESTKDLAKALAKQCVVFNCSDQMDYLMVAKFFKGLASSGAWCCFDEFNRINIEVLSVIAMQLQQLFSEKAMGKQYTFFEGNDIKLNPSFSVFITMNPGYAGRTELPDNLKALFRGVAMMVPSYAVIAEIRLYSFGFRQGRDLARKIVSTFTLASESLSSQFHYDYGMRAVTSVINNAGILKKQDMDMDEDKLVLRALRDVNVPKFLSHDLPLFENIIKDLFPTTDKPIINYGALTTAIKEQAVLLGYQKVNIFVEKILQLYDTIQVRHGLMLVGPTGGGKSANYRTLQKALTSLQNEGYYNVITHILNPKSITMGQLYGCFNEQTREWTDGVLAYMIREAIKDRSDQKHWVVFDGPVDALWIESMNTVLDDNKKLCLNSGQILTLTPHMTMMFEVEDLLVASPATVSRCGMVYMEPVSLGMQPIIDSWITNSIPPNLTLRKIFISKIQNLISIFLQKTVNYLRDNCLETDQTSNNQLAQSLARLLSCFIEPYRETEYKKISIEEIEILESQIESIFIFSVIWSLCCTVDNKSRNKMDIFIKSIITENKIEVGLKLFEQYPTNTIYQFRFNTAENKFILWSQDFSSFEIDPKLQYHEVMVPTIDSTRNIFITKTLLQNKFHVMCPGPTGTGKSQNLYTLLGNQMGEDFQYIALTFSAQTSANSTQDTIDSKFVKRRKGIFGPPVGKKCVIFVDDLNMPKKEEFFAQPPLELLRQFLDHQGWYDRKTLSFMKLEDIILLTAQGPPGGGRTYITARLKRHFNVLSYTEIEDTEVKQIFGTLCRSFLKKFQENVRNQIEKVLDATLEVYKQVKIDLLPTPSKSHYLFNMRDIWRVIQGICAGSSRNIVEANDICRLWYHENMRIYHDRLTTESDREIIKNILYQRVDGVFKLNKSDINNAERILFGDFLQGRDVEIRQYQQINDIETLLLKMERFQDDFNSDSSFSGGGKKQMKLVLFLDACEHICRIARIIRQPQGNAFLMGMGGSGRQSLSKMATFISNFKLFQIEVIKNYNFRAWREDVKKLLMLAGVENKAVCFLFVDTQIISEQMLEDINNILNSGDVTGVYNPKDIDDIKKACKADCVKKGLQPNDMNIFSSYLARIKKNIHVIIAMSPLGNIFLTRLRMFPSLVNCCTIDWFTEWPDEALLGVGKGSLQDFEEELGLQGQLNILVEMFKIIHKSVEKTTIKFRDEIRRYNYVTPTSFLELLNLFRMFLTEKRSLQFKSIDRLKNGLDKLNAANEAVEEMGIQLKQMQPILEQTQKETIKTMQKLKVDNEEASKQQIIVSREEIQAKQQAAEANQLAEEAEEAVRDANEKLMETLKLVAKLRKEHIQEIKTFNIPTPCVKLVIKGVVLILMDDVKKNGGKLIIKQEAGKKEEDYFETCKKYLMIDPQWLLDRMKGYQEEAKSIKQSTIKKLDLEVINQEEFNITAAQNSSYVIQFLFNWVKAMHSYNIEYIRAGPLRKQMEDMKQIVADKEAELKIKKESLLEINNKIQELETMYREKVKLQEELTKKITDCEIKKDRAEKLTGGLKDEKVRWTHDIASLSSQLDLLAGDSLVSAGMVSYAGPFTNFYRAEMESGWIAKLKELEIKHSADLKMTKFLGEQVKIQSWNLAGLPKDDTSIENGIIIDKSRRWPLMIDPQNQANKYIKNMGRDQPETIEVLKTTDPNLMRTIELSIQFGKWVLVENVGESLDPSLEPVLLQQTTKQGSSLTIVIGDKNIPYNESFKFFLTTTLPNPHYTPETCVKVTIINFAITPSGLEEQMLATIVGLENPTLEQKKIEIVRKNAADKKELLNIEDSILKSLGETKGGIEEMLADETLINKLSSSKKFAQEINQRVKDSKITEEQIDIIRDSYRPVAYRASLLFFCIIDLSTIDPMYQYSLQWFNYLFVNSVDEATPSNILEERLKTLNDFFTYQLYENICRSLFETHKLLFSFILTVKILQGRGEMVEAEWRYLLTGPTGEIKIEPNPTNWIAENSWPDIYRQFFKMDIQITALKGIKDYFIQNIQEFKPLYDSSDPQDCILPGKWHETLTTFQKLIVLKALRSDKLINGVQNWISEQIGKQFIMNPSWEYAKCFKDSKVTTPLIIILSSGSDPKDDFTKFCEEMGMSKKNDTISLGQGQGVKAANLIKEGQNRGYWVLLQNCHLAKTWMSELEKICEDLNENIHKDFRLWMTSRPSSDFPISVLQNGIKMTMEPPKGLRNNLLRTYQNFDDKELDDCVKPDDFKKLLFGFSLFHAIILDRRKFGPIGWNIAYDFTMEDFIVCKRQLKMLLDEYPVIPFKVLQFLGSEINYGGRVTDDKDIRLITTLIKQYVTPEALRVNHFFSPSGIYKQPEAGNLQSYLNYIMELPLNPEPEAFGLHDNAAITNAQNETRALLETILSIQPRESNSGAVSREQQIEEIAEMIQKKCPEEFNEKQIGIDYGTNYNESMNTVLLQEVIRYNRLLSLMITTLVDVKKALKGTIQLSEELEMLANSLFDNQVPLMWAEVGFLSMKPLASWIEDLERRVGFLSDWIVNGTPKIFWISGFFFPQAFVTGTLQNFSRKYVIPIDCISFEFSFQDTLDATQVQSKPDDGCLIYGMFLEGAKWDYKKHLMSHSSPKELFSDLPPVHLVPIANRVAPTEGIYRCPLYKVEIRKGNLSTTGHSTNFVMFSEIPTLLSQDIWIKAGVATFLALRY